MSDDSVTLLEHRVAAAVQRLRDLSADKHRLEGELRLARQELEALRNDREAKARELDASETRWEARVGGIAERLREAIDELRSDGSSVRP